MKRTLMFVVAVVVLGTAAWAISAAEEKAVTESKAEAKTPAKMQMEPCPACAMMTGGQDKEMMNRHKEMMTKAGISEKQVRRCQAMVNAPLYEDSPAVLLGAVHMLGLTNEQKAKLEEIEKDAHQKAREVLSTDQQKKLEEMSAGQMTLNEMRKEIHKKMMPAMKEMTKEGKVCCCPMMMPRGGKQGHEEHAEKAVNSKCPITGQQIDPAKVPDSLTRQYKGQKVAFCCPACPPQWDKLSDAEKDAKLKAAM